MKKMRKREDIDRELSNAFGSDDYDEQSKWECILEVLLDIRTLLDSLVKKESEQCK